MGTTSSSSYNGTGAVSAAGTSGRSSHIVSTCLHGSNRNMAPHSIGGGAASGWSTGGYGAMGDESLGEANKHCSSGTPGPGSDRNAAPALSAGNAPVSIGGGADGRDWDAAGGGREGTRGAAAAVELSGRGWGRSLSEGEGADVRAAAAGNIKGWEGTGDGREGVAGGGTAGGSAAAVVGIQDWATAGGGREGGAAAAAMVPCGIEASWDHRPPGSSHGSTRPCTSSRGSTRPCTSSGDHSIVIR